MNILLIDPNNLSGEELRDALSSGTLWNIFAPEDLEEMMDESIQYHDGCLTLGLVDDTGYTEWFKYQVGDQYKLLGIEHTDSYTIVDPKDSDAPEHYEECFAWGIVMHKPSKNKVH